MVQIYSATTPFDTVYAEVERTLTTQVNLKFNTAPTSGEFIVMVTKIQ